MKKRKRHQRLGYFLFFQSSQDTNLVSAKELRDAVQLNLENFGREPPSAGKFRFDAASVVRRHVHITF
jgi:hypothetical protein